MAADEDDPEDEREDDRELDAMPDDPAPPVAADAIAEPESNPWVPAGTSFCPECGTENDAGTSHCRSCNRVLDPLASAVASTSPSRAMRGSVVAVVAGICMIAVAIAWFSDLSLQLSVRTILKLQVDRLVEVRTLYSSAGASEVFGLSAVFGLAGLVSAVVFGGRYLREVALGATAGVFVQACLWLYMAHDAGGELGGDLSIVGKGFVMHGPAAILLTQLLLMMLFAALGFAFVGWIAREQLTGKATCVHCHTPYSIRPSAPVRCPKCDAEQDRDGVQWPWVMLVALVNALVFAAVVAWLREPLGFALECGKPLSSACSSAQIGDEYSRFVTATSRLDYTFWAVDQWLYLEVTAVLMLIAPLVLTFLVKRGSRASAGALVPINWILASFVVMVVLGEITSSTGGFVFLLKMQILALILWSVAGVIGVLVGDKLRYRKGSAYLDEVEG